MGYTGRFTWKVQGQKSFESQFFKVTNKGKPPRMFSLACNLTKNDVKFPPVKISSKKVRANNVGSYTIKITSKKVRGNGVIFGSSKLHRKKYVEMVWIFGSSKLHQKSTRKWHGNSSKFGIGRIDVISTWNRLWFDLVYPLGLKLDKLRIIPSTKLSIALKPLTLSIYVADCNVRYT